MCQFKCISGKNILCIFTFFKTLNHSPAQNLSNKKKRSFLRLLWADILLRQFTKFWHTRAILCAPTVKQPPNLIKEKSKLIVTVFVGTTSCYSLCSWMRDDSLSAPFPSIPRRLFNFTLPYLPPPPTPALSIYTENRFTLVQKQQLKIAPNITMTPKKTGTVTN